MGIFGRDAVVNGAGSLNLDQASFGVVATFLGLGGVGLIARQQRERGA